VLQLTVLLECDVLHRILLYVKEKVIHSRKDTNTKSDQWRVNMKLNACLEELILYRKLKLLEALFVKKVASGMALRNKNL
jgi:hypothetical protein